MHLTKIEIYNGIGFADENQVFKALEEVYNEIPSLKCGRCGQCCADNPRISLLEYINIYKYVRDSLKFHWAEIVDKCITNYFLDLVEPSLNCPFLGEDNQCMIYQIRPFNCRVFGHKSKEEFEMDFTKGIFEQVKNYWRQHGIIIPDEVMKFKPYYCEEVQPLQGKKLGLKNITSIMNKLIAVERRMFSLEIIMDNDNYIPFYKHFTDTVIGLRANKKKPDVMKEYLENKQSDLLKEFLEKGKKFEF
ncbi:protein of unknown function UPF0153 [Desulfofarcimen acetoxidans DSM 771]|uniref:YkgJ family cysteine cluster protein n=1 Tax=Desulfofarcimen acetoxidans (strain ATCC 49208 / DSM 771 / KCTC 5769 / VKM B-1644 / 5575) TaxID=485916 RepID=C8W5G6_DESAS|nr:YkgJ family cysteine cluster protein [Desulfofarcimen acetoxidans]ACV62148.1 protein of unknown function UPF0153 [Desulfofarcimen acetoxidans DSM 771]